MIETARILSVDSWLFFMFLGAFALVVWLKYTYPQFFVRDTLHLFYFSDSMADAPSAKNNASYRVLSSFLFAYVAAMVIFMWYTKNTHLSSYHINDMLMICLITSGYVVLRYLMDVLLLWLFDMQDMTSKVLDKNTAFRLAIAVWGAVAFFVLWYLCDGLNMATTQTELILFLLVYIVLYFLCMVEYLVQKMAYFLYFILYLCGVEICPLILGWILIKNVLTT